ATRECYPAPAVQRAAPTRAAICRREPPAAAEWSAPRAGRAVRAPTEATARRQTLATTERSRAPAQRRPASTPEPTARPARAAGPTWSAALRDRASRVRTVRRAFPRIRAIRGPLPAPPERRSASTVAATSTPARLAERTWSAT